MRPRSVGLSLLRHFFELDNNKAVNISLICYYYGMRIALDRRSADKLLVFDLNKSKQQLNRTGMVVYPCAVGAVGLFFCLWGVCAPMQSRFSKFFERSYGR